MRTVANRVARLATLLTILGLSMPGSVGALSLEEFLGDLRESHPIFESEELAIAAVEAERETLRPTYTWSIEGGPSYTTLGEVNSFDTGAKRTHNATVTARALRTLPSGGALSTGVRSDVLLLTGAPTLFGTEDLERYTQGIEASYLQPLLLNRGDELRRIGFDLARYDAEARRIESREVRETFLADSALLYIDWAGTVEELEVARLRVSLAEEQLSQVRSLFEANLIDRVDLLRAQTALQGAKQLVAEVEATEAALRRQLELLADRNYRDAEPRFEFSDLGVTGLSVSFDDSAETGAPGVGPIPRAAQPLSVLIEQLRARRNATSLRTKPELNLEVSAGLYGGDDTFGESFFLDSPDASIGLVGRIPLDHPGVDAERRLFDAQIAQLSADIGRVQREVASAAGGLATQLERLQGVIELSEAQLETALEKTKEEQLLYRQARVPLTTVIESQDEEQRIRLAVLQARVRYHALAIRYRSLTDRLLQ